MVTVDSEVCGLSGSGTLDIAYSNTNNIPFTSTLSGRQQMANIPNPDKHNQIYLHVWFFSILICLSNPKGLATPSLWLSTPTQLSASSFLPRFSIFSLQPHLSSSTFSLLSLWQLFSAICVFIRHPLRDKAQMPLTVTPCSWWSVCICVWPWSVRANAYKGKSALRNYTAHRSSTDFLK